MFILWLPCFSLAMRVCQIHSCHYAACDLNQPLNLTGLHRSITLHVADSRSQA
jgi:hypothetical protein